MKKILILLFSYVIIDGIGYYYGVGNGWISKKLPNNYYIDYGSFDKKNTSISIMESEMNLFLVYNGEEIELGKNRKIKIYNIKGYYFDDYDIIIEIYDFQKNIYLLKIDNDNYKFIETERKDIKNHIYINLKYSKEYCLIINLIKIYIILVTIYSSLSLIKKMG